MLTELCQELHNWFEREIHTGSFTITGGTITADFLQANQYYRVCGSIFNDGIHQYGKEAQGEMVNETFDGAVWALGIPKAVIDLAEEISAWREKYEAADSAALSPFNSESFGGYSYSKSAGNGSGGNSTGVSWQTVFGSRLNMWRKL